MVVPTFCFAGRLSITMSAHCRFSHWRWAGGRGVKGGPLARLRLYEWIIEKKFPSWIRSSFGVRKRTVYLLQDHEKALWAEEPRAAMVKVGVELLENYPKCSQDLNPIETAWRELRARLADTQPTQRETRDSFIQRLRRAVAWINANRVEYLYHLGHCQVQWADDILKVKGSRTKH